MTIISVKCAKRIRLFRCALALLSMGIGLVSARAAEKDAITLSKVRSGTAFLRQQQRLTILELKSPAGPVQRIALTHPSDYRQGTNAPIKTELIAESSNHFLIFTDTFASNPGNVQGRCGADETGERFLHVVALGAIPHETLSVLIESCLLNLQPTSRSPKWIAKTDSAGFTGRIILTFEQSTHPNVVYYVAPDGAVTRPQSDDEQAFLSCRNIAITLTTSPHAPSPPGTTIF